MPLKKSKSREPFRSYQLNSTANPAHLPQNWAKFEVNGLDWQCTVVMGALKMFLTFFSPNWSLCHENLEKLNKIVA